MNNIKNKILIAMVCLSGAITIGSCNKFEDFGDRNINPNSSTYVSTGTLLSAVQVRLANYLFSTVVENNSPASELLSGYLAQYFAEPTYPQASLYSPTSLAVSTSAPYQGVLYDLKRVIDRNADEETIDDAAKSGSNANQIAMARIMKAYVYWVITDKWGNVPYSEALLSSENLTPKYDAQETIYTDLIKELKEAKAQFDNGMTVNADLIYEGNTAQWKKFANSLRMLIALRMSKVYPDAAGMAAQEFSSAASDADGYIESNEDNFKVFFPANANPYNNPYNGPFSSADNGISETYTKLLSGLDDPRMEAHATNTTGVPYGDRQPASTAISWGRILNISYKEKAGTVHLINAASVLLAAAEAAELGWISGNAEDLYDSGVAESFDQWDVDMPADYLSTGLANFTSGAGVDDIGGTFVPGSSAATTTPLQRIQLQQYIAFFPDGHQGWSNWRRTGVPGLKPTTKALNDSKQISRRFTYGSIDYQTNEEKVTEAAGAMGGDNDAIRMWWDK